MNTKYISSSGLKTSEFSRVRSTSENSDIFNSRDEIYLVFTGKSEFSFHFILFGDLRLVEKQCLEPKNKGLFVTENLDQLGYSYRD